MPDDLLVDQLRAWADDLADQVPPVAAPTAERGGHGRPARMLALAAAVLVVLAVIGGVVATRDDDDGRVRTDTTSSTTEAGPDVPLVGTSWWLAELEVDGAAVPLDAAIRQPFVEVGPCPPEADCALPDAITGNDGCNSFGGSVVIGDRDLVISDVASTQMGCADPVSTAMSEVIRDDVGFAITGGRLTLQAGGVVATFRPGDGRFPPRPEGASVLDVPGLDPHHRVTWRAVGGAVELEVVLYDMNVPDTLTVEHTGAEGEMAATARSGRRPTYVVGLVDARATDVTFVRDDGGRIGTATLALDGEPSVRAFVVEVPGVGGPWTLEATDTAGTVVATFAPPP